MPSIPVDLRDWLAAHHGVASAKTLAEFGLSPHAIRRLRESGVLVHLGRGVYRIAGAPVTEESRMVALCEKHPDSFITGSSGGRLRNIRGSRRDRRIHLAVGPGQNVRVERGVVVHQTVHRQLGLDMEERPDGIRVATGARLAADLAGDMTAKQLASAVEQLLADGHSTIKKMVDMVKRRTHAQRPKPRSSLARVLLARIPGGPMESGYEVVLGNALRDAGVPIVAQQRLLHIPDGGPPVRIDLAVPDLRWGIEVDIHPEHAVDAGALDKQRDRRCQLIDWQTSRYSQIDFIDLAATVAELVALYHARITALSARNPRGSVASRDLSARED